MPPIPARIGNFEVVRQIGAGGMGAVYLGRDPELDRQVAIKVIREEVHDQEVLDRFFREARAAAALRHPNIITIYASGQHEHQPYMAMEFVDGESLAEIIKQRRPLTLADKMSFLDQLCAGLHFAHRAGIVHRDIKPANVMVDREGVVRILDFGIARIEGSAMTQDGAMIGSLNYMSPEQMLGRPVDLRSDIFSVGSVAYELLCYQQAFKGGLTDGLLQRLPHEDPPSLTGLYPGLTPALERVVMRALEKAPERRFQNLAEMRSAIVEAQGSVQPDDERTVMIPRAGRPAAASEAPSSPSAGAPIPSGSGQPAGTAINVLSGPQQFGETVFPAPPSPPALERPSTTRVLPASQVQPPPLQAPPAMHAPAITQGPPATHDPVATKAPAATQASPASQSAEAKKPAPATLKPAPATSKPASTVTKRPIVAPPPAPSRSRMWILIGSACGALIIGVAAALPYLTAKPPSVMEREGPGIESAMGRFRSAYRNRDLPGIEAVFPALPRASRQTMQKSFVDCLVYEVTFDGMKVAIDPANESAAQVDVNSTHTCTPNSGARQFSTARHDVFTLSKKGDAWLIDSVAEPAAGSPDRSK